MWHNSKPGQKTRIMGITTTVPIEILLAADCKPVDLNNLFVSDPDPQRLIDIAHHLALPLATLVFAYFPGNFLLTRNSMMIVIKACYIETARAKGLPPLRIRYAHAARNALQPIVTRFGLRLAFMITGALVVERINSYPGLGTLLFNAIQARDLPVIQAVVLFSSLIVLGIILGMESVYRLIDPRIRHAH